MQSCKLLPFIQNITKILSLELDKKNLNLKKRKKNALTIYGSVDFYSLLCL